MAQLLQQAASDPSPANSNKKRIILTIAGGGFFWQSKSVAVGLDGPFEFHYVTSDDPAAYANRGLPAGEFHHVSSITTQEFASFIRKLANTIACFQDAYKVIRLVNPEAVICVASSIAVPLCFWAKLLGKTTVFVESITRVTDPSMTGRILSGLRLCDRLYVQWPEAERLYRGAIYRGAVV